MAKEGGEGPEEKLFGDSSSDASTKGTELEPSYEDGNDAHVAMISRT